MVLMDAPRRPHLKFSRRRRGPPTSLSHEQRLATSTAFTPSPSRSLPLEKHEGRLSSTDLERQDRSYSSPIKVSSKLTALANGTPIKAQSASPPPVPFTQKKASGAPTQYPAQPIYRLQTAALRSKALPKILPQGKHVPQAQVSQLRGSSDRSPPGANAPALPLVTSTQELASQRAPVRTNLNADSVRDTPSPILPLGAMTSKPSAITPPTPLVTSNTTSTSTYPKSIVDSASATEAYNAKVANQIHEENLSSGLRRIGLTAIIIVCLILVSITGMVLYWVWRRLHHRRAPLQKGVVESSASRTKFGIFDEGEGSILDSISQGHSIIDHPLGPLINCRSEGFVLYSDIISDAYSSSVRPSPTNVIECSDGGHGDKTTDTKTMNCATPPSRPVDSRVEKSFLDYSHDDVLSGSVFVAAHSFDPRLPDELTVSAGDRVQVEIRYDDGWCFGTNLDAELRSVAREAPLVTTGVFPLECLKVPAARQPLVSGGKSQLSGLSAKPPGSGTSSKELPEHIKSYHWTLPAVPEIGINPGDEFGGPNISSSIILPDSAAVLSGAPAEGQNKRHIRQFGHALGPD